MPKSKHKTINLALQGGGAHGAFAWGVLDALIADGRITIEGICATSAGTMNACAFAYGMFTGGPDGAREALHNFWQAVSKSGEAFNPAQRTPFETMFAGMNGWNRDHSPGFFAFDTLTRMFSPYQLNPFDFNPLREILEKTIDFEQLQKCDCTKLFISATHVRSGKVRVFHAEQLTLDVVMASACLPYMFKAVEVEGEDYWDGGYMGNPALFPLFYDTDSRDVVIVHINPLERQATPKTAPDIMNRVNEISFNSSLIKEMRAIAFVQKLVRNDMLKPEYEKNFKDVLVHSIRADDAMKDLSVASKFDSSWEFLTHLRDLGRDTANDWLKRNFKHLGEQDTVDLHGEFLYSVDRFFEQRN